MKKISTLAIICLFIAASLYSADLPKIESVELLWDLTKDSEGYTGTYIFGLSDVADSDASAASLVPSISISQSDINTTSGLVAEKKLYLYWDFIALQKVKISLYSDKLKADGTSTSNTIEWTGAWTSPTESTPGVAVTNASLSKSNYGSADTPIEVFSFDPLAVGADMSEKGCVEIDFETVDASNNSPAKFSTDIYIVLASAT